MITKRDYYAEGDTKKAREEANEIFEGLTNALKWGSREYYHTLSGNSPLWAITRLVESRVGEFGWELAVTHVDEDQDGPRYSDAYEIFEVY